MSERFERLEQELQKVKDQLKEQIMQEQKRDSEVVEALKIFAETQKTLINAFGGILEKTIEILTSTKQKTAEKHE
jgi:uncharacterized protein (UPF0335 family)